MAEETQTRKPKIFILATLSGGYAGADSVGQLHTDYAANTCVFPVRSPAMFPEELYLRTFERGIDAILVMYSGTDSPYKGDAHRKALLINRVYPWLKQRGIRYALPASGGQLYGLHESVSQRSGPDERPLADDRPGEARTQRAAASRLKLPTRG